MQLKEALCRVRMLLSLGYTCSHWTFNTDPSWVWTQVVYLLDTEDGKWALTLIETGPWRKKHPSENNQPEASACRQWGKLSLLNGAGRDYVDADNFTSLWNKFRQCRMVQGDVCSWSTSAENFPYLQWVLCILTLKGTNKQGWIIVAVGEFNLSGWKQRATLFENPGRLHSLAHRLCNGYSGYYVKYRCFSVV